MLFFTHTNIPPLSSCQGEGGWVLVVNFIIVVLAFEMLSSQRVGMPSFHLWKVYWWWWWWVGGLFDYNVKPGPDFSRSRLGLVRLLKRSAKDKFDQVGCQVSQVKDQVGQGKGQELDICKNLHSDQVLFHLSLEIDPLNPALCCLLYGHSNQ